jgi:hypothetical protein
MMSKTAAEKIMELCMQKVGCGYAWGAQGETLTREILDRLVRTYGRERYYFNGYSAEKWLGKQVFDCSGLIVWAANTLGILQGDYTAEGLYYLCDHVTDPIPGDWCFNFYLTHVGIYIGNNQYLHAMGTAYGVVITNQYTFVRFGRYKGGDSLTTDWNEKNKEFVKYVQGIVGTEVDGMAGPKTREAFDKYVKQHDGANEIKTAWANFLRTIGKEF